MEKLELKLKNLDYFLMKLGNATMEEKMILLEMNEKMKKKVKEIKEGKEVKNEMVQMGEISGGDTSVDSRSNIEEKGRKKG